MRDRKAIVCLEIAQKKATEPLAADPLIALHKREARDPTTAVTPLVRDARGLCT
ncbi:MAG TPA: hypothetical protein VFN26_23555 [Candidatus Acidoferrum sp.]|nr:hypothetical protein [Candidatus Acidoferrum sp.]